MAAKNPLKRLREADKNPFETGTNLVSDAAKTVRDELSEDWKISIRQMLGVSEQATRTPGKLAQLEGELSEGEELVLIGTKKEKKAEIEPGIDYVREIIHAETIHSQKDNRELRQRVGEIQIELRKLSKSSKELEVTFKNVSVETINMPVNPGKYHLNFFEWMLATIQNARMRIEDSASWLNVVSGK